jgi:hypothetical protein
MRGDKIFALTVVILLAASCTNMESRKALKETDIHEVVAVEAFDAAGYTYLLVSEGRKKNWLAVSEMDVEPGKTYYYRGGLKMVNFKSRELDRVFESIIFVDQFGEEPPLPQEEMSLSTAHAPTIPVEKLDISIEVPENGISIAELLSNRKSYQGKRVIIRGQVTKFNADIMDKNWIHIQDGTEHEGLFDLTITSDMEVDQGAIVTFEGTIALNQDFGFGYFYDVILEEAKLID